jgi:hypothetical protein
MYRAIQIAIFLFILQLPAWAQPDGVRVSTWVREDLFAGFLVDDMDRLETGMQKLDEILAQEPSDLGALAWRASVDYYLALRAHEADNRVDFERLYGRAMDAFRSLYESAPEEISVLAVTSGATSLMAGRFPEPQKTESYQLSRDRFEQLARLQRENFDKMPLHHRAGRCWPDLLRPRNTLGTVRSRVSI